MARQGFSIKLNPHHRLQIRGKTQLYRNKLNKEYPTSKMRILFRRDKSVPSVKARVFNTST